MYVYIKSEASLFTVGFYDPQGKWNPESDHESPEKAAAQVHYLNGGKDFGREAATDPDLMARHWPEACLAQVCPYYTHYLKHGPADIPHAAYHEAERECERAQEFALSHDGKPLGASFERFLARLETRIRA